jgi:hypothetical protein
MTPRLSALATVLTLGVSGCGVALPSAGTSTAGLLCHSERVERGALEAARPASELGADGQAALQGHEVRGIGDPAKWTVLEESADDVVLIRELSEPHGSGGGQMPTHELLAIENLGTGNPDGIDGWHLRTSSWCDLRRDLGRLGSTDLALDPEALPREEATSVALLVTERACASGEPATGRIEVVDVARTDSELQVVLGVEQVRGSAACPGNPPTPFTLELEEPLGARTLVDASAYPSRPVTVAPPN